MSMQWYVVHTYSGFENKAKQSLEERIKTHHMEDFFGEILIPTETVVELKKGKKQTTTRKFFPGYLLVNMELNNETWHTVRSTPKITGFVGGSTNPPSLPEEEVLRITSQISEGTMTPKTLVSFEKGESIRIIDGPFSSFTGYIDEVKPEKSKVRVLVNIFGRPTPVDLDFVQVEKN